MSISSPSSPLPSSSAVTIPIPGKSILKKPPPPQTSLFTLNISRLNISRFLPSSNVQGQPKEPGNTQGQGGSRSAGGWNASTTSTASSVSAAGSSSATSATDDAEKPLKRAHFILPHIATVYPISSQNPPSMPNLKDEKRIIEDRERERRRRVVRGNSSGSGSAYGGSTASLPSLPPPTSDADSELPSEELWSVDKVEGFYRECCEGCGDPPDVMISTALKKIVPGPSRTLDLSGVQLSVASAGILADVLTIEWGLRKLVCKECDLDEFNLRPILHSLLIPNSLTFLSLASNKKLVTSKDRAAFKLISAFISKSSSLAFLDLSQNPLDKRCVELLVASFTQKDPSPEPEATTLSSSLYGLTPYPIPTSHASTLTSLRLDDCNLRGNSLEILARTLRTSNLKHISLRYNKITSPSAVAIALMIRDYPDAVTGGVGVVNGVAVHSPPLGLNGASLSGSGTNSPSSILSPPGTPITTTSPSLPLPSSSASSPAVSSAPLTGPLPPPPRHPLHPPPRHPQHAQSQQPPSQTQTTYTPYVPKSRRTLAAQAASPASVPSSPIIKPQQITPTPYQPSSLQARLAAAASGTAKPSTGSTGGPGNVTPPLTRHGAAAAHAHDQGPSAALLDKVRALDALPRIGNIRTLDLKGNDIRTGVTYIAQVLKRNRTLKVLNLSENKLDVQGLVAIAEALKYNSCLETLDLSKNPVSSPSLSGILSLRTAFTLNTSLRRLFLSSTHLNTQSALALASFLPSSRSLLHLDLTQNPGIGLEGVTALCEGLRGNWVMRCLDLDVPVGDEAFAGVCREILRLCVRNTEEAEKAMAEREKSSDLNSGSCSASIVADDDAATGGSHRDSRDTGDVPGEDGKGKARDSPKDGSTNGWKGQAKGVWMMLEGSELAKGVRMGQMEQDVTTRAKFLIRSINESLNPILPTIPETDQTLSPVSATPGTLVGVLDRLRAPALLSTAASAFGTNLSSASSSTSSLALSGGQAQALSLPELILQSKEAMAEMSRDIEVTMTRGSPNPGEGDMSRESLEAGRLEEKLLVYDELVDTLAKAEARVASGLDSKVQHAQDVASLDSHARGHDDETGAKPSKPVLSLKGLGVQFNDTGSPPVINQKRWISLGSSTTPIDSPDPEITRSYANLGATDSDSDPDLDPPTPRIDKGKGKAVPLPDPLEKVLSPTKALMEDVLSLTSGASSSDEDEDGYRAPFVDAEEGDAGLLSEDGTGGDASGKALMEERSKSWVEEEGEVFRKGAVLLGPEEMEGEYAGDDLRKELLDAMVERQPRARPMDEFGFNDPEAEAQIQSPRDRDVSRQSSSNPGTPLQTPLSPTDSVHSFSSVHSTQSHAAMPPSSTAPSAAAGSAQTKLPPRPYVSRSRSSSSLMSLATTVIEGSGGTTASPSQSPAPVNVKTLGPIDESEANVLGGGKGISRREG